MYKCSKCPMTFIASYLLENHEQKTIPCDFKCKIKDCPFTGRDRFDYYRHQKRHIELKQKENAQKEENERKEQKEQKERKERKEQQKERKEQQKEQKELTRIEAKSRPKENGFSLVPIEDFNSQTLKESLRKTSNNVQHHSVGILHGWAGLGNMGVAEVSITTYEIRAEELRKMIADDVLVCVLKSFEFDTSEIRKVEAVQPRLEDRISQLQRQIRPYAYIPEEGIPPLPVEDNFPQMLLELLSGVHAGDNERLHSICMGDISRQTVNFFSRSPLNDKTYWQANTKAMSIKKIQAHVKELYKFVIEAVTASLKAATIKSTGEFVWYLQANSQTYLISDGPLTFRPADIEPQDDADDFVSMMDDFYAAQNSGIVNVEEPVRNKATITIVSMDDIQECLDHEYPDKRMHLANLVETKKAQLLAKLNRFELDSNICVNFFNESYAICVNTLKASKNIITEK